MPAAHYAVVLTAWLTLGFVPERRTAPLSAATRRRSATDEEIAKVRSRSTPSPALRSRGGPQQLGA